MKKILTVLLIILLMLVIGCGNSKKSEDVSREAESVPHEVVIEKKIYAGSQQRSCFVIKKKEDIAEFLSAANRGDAEYVDKMVWDGKAFFIDYDTRILSMECEEYPAMVFVMILEGKFKDYEGYTFRKRVYAIRKAPTE